MMVAATVQIRALAQGAEIRPVFIMCRLSEATRRR